MKCPNCKKEMVRVLVSIEGASTKAVSWQCATCDRFTVEPASARMALDELESPLRLQQRVVKISQGRLGLYLGKDVVRSLGLKGGETVELSVPSKKRLVIDLK